MKKSKPPPAPPTTPAEDLPAPTTIRFKTNVIIQVPEAPGGSRFIVAGMESPYRSLDEIPPILRPHIITPGSESESEFTDDEPRSLTFQLNTTYAVDADGRRRARNIRREIINLERAQQEDDTLEEYLSSDPDEKLKAALEDVEEDRQARVAHQRAEAESYAKQCELADEAAQQFIDEQGDTEGVT